LVFGLRFWNKNNKIMLTKEEIKDKIEDEIVVDCYDEYEAQGWLCTMEDDLEFPFEATAEFKKKDGSVELKQVTITGLAADDDDFMGTDFDLEMSDGDYIKNVKYSKLSNIIASEQTMDLFQCWDYWVKKY
jgi:hypothetical protein